MHFPLAHIRVLLKPVFWFGVFVTVTFRTKAWSNEVVTEMGDATLQRQQAQTSIGS
jgi:hypothetical protein